MFTKPRKLEEEPQQFMNKVKKHIRANLKHFFNHSYIKPPPLKSYKNKFSLPFRLLKNSIPPLYC